MDMAGLERVKRAVIRRYPITASLALSNLEIKLTDEIETAAVRAERNDKGKLEAKKLFVNPEFMDALPFNEQVFILAHEALHIALKHFARSERKPVRDAEKEYEEYCLREKDEFKRAWKKAYLEKHYQQLWNIATDACINAFLRKDGFSFPQNIIDPKTGQMMKFIYMEEGLFQSAEKIYDYLVQKEKDKKQQQQQNQQNQQNQENQQGQQGQQQQQQSQQQQNGDGESQEQKSQDGGSQDGESQEKGDSESKDNQNGKGKSQKSKNTISLDDIDPDDYQGFDSHDSWRGDEEEKDKEDENSKSSGEDKKQDEKDSDKKDSDKQDSDKKDSDKEDSNKKDSDKEDSNKKDSSNGQDEDEDEIDDAEFLEKEIEIREGSKSSEQSDPSKAISRLRLKNGLEECKPFKPVISWKRLLVGMEEKTVEVWGNRRSSRYNPNARIEERTEEMKPSVEVVLDVSGSISAELLRGFLLQLYPIMQEVFCDEGLTMKVGSFSNGFSGFTELKSKKDIMEYKPVRVGGTGTNFEAAATAFSKDPGKRITKIVFTDGELGSPQRTRVPDIRWIVFGDKMDFTPLGGTIIKVSDEDFKKMMETTKFINLSDEEDEYGGISKRL